MQKNHFLVLKKLKNTSSASYERQDQQETRESPHMGGHKNGVVAHAVFLAELGTCGIFGIFLKIESTYFFKTVTL